MITIFTGLVEEMGQVLSIKTGEKSVHLKIKWQQTEAVRRPSRIIQNHQSLKFSTSWFLTDFLNGGGFDWWSTSCIL